MGKYVKSCRGTGLHPSPELFSWPGPLLARPAAVSLSRRRRACLPRGVRLFNRGKKGLRPS